MKSIYAYTIGLAFSASVIAAELPIASGPFVGTRDSLTNYSCPEWFRDAKFGIWAHWGPQAVPMEGDWYARKMYQQGSPQYQHHLETYGHPSTNGWKDVIPLWKAEKWEPEKLIELYKKAGAKYFVSMGTHHDNFFLWNSKLHKWNSVLVGPQRDVVGEWQAAAKKNGLPFGVSEHLGASFSWFQDSHKSDKTGPLAGVPYDGANSNNWDLYHFPAAPDDKSTWYTKDSRWQQQWYSEIKELVDNYHPDLLYSDGPVVFGNEVGLSQIANLYNLSAADHGGKSEAIYNCKEPSAGRWVQDYERGVGGGISPVPWQTDTSIGDWFYNRHWKYQPLSWTVHMLVDITSKNGNLLLNVVLRPDGTLDPEVETMLHELADWTAVNGEAIYATRPWQIFGEGEVKAKGGAFKENFTYSAKDIRFTTKGATLYAIAMGWPAENKMLIHSLANTGDPKQNQIKRVDLLGSKTKLHFTQTAEGLLVELPGNQTNNLTCSLRITGDNLTPAPLPQAVIAPDNKGHFVFQADDAVLHGENLKLEEQGGQSVIGFWDNPNEWVSWNAKAQKPGQYRVTATVASANGVAQFVTEIGDESIIASASQTSGWDKFATFELGVVNIKNAGDFTLKVRAKDTSSWLPINLNSIQLSLVE
jgi:alpha-L-fucosidase